MTDVIMRGSGPLEAEYAVVAQYPRPEELGRGAFNNSSGLLFREWLESADIDPESVYYSYACERVCRRAGDVKASDLKRGRLRLLEDELPTLPNLKGVILVGTHAAKLVVGLSGGMSRAHGKQGTLTLGDGREVSCIVCYDPGYVRQTPDLRRQQILDRDCRTVVARVRLLDVEVVLPAAHIVPTAAVTGLIGLDVETESEPSHKYPDPRIDTLLFTGLSDGRIVMGGDPITIAPEAEVIVHNVPFDGVALGIWDVRWHDSKMLAHLMGEPWTELKSLGTRILNRTVMSYDEAFHADEETKRRYCVQDCELARDLLAELMRRADADTMNVYNVVERPMMPLYTRWTIEGVFRLDRPAARVRLDKLLTIVDAQAEELAAALGVENPGSPIQVAERLRLPDTTKERLTDLIKAIVPVNGVPVSVLATLLEWRSLKRMVGTYLEAWFEWPHDLLGTYWRPTGTWPGRASSANLNLQNVPGPCGACEPCLARNERECPYNLRPLLLAPEGYVMYEADNSQAELRVAAHLSQDQAMIAAFEGDSDIHEWARAKLDLPDNEGGRRTAKIGVLATFYGAMAGAQTTRAISDELRRRFATYFSWADRVGQLSVVPGLFGRHMYVPPHPNPKHREREAVNCGPQGGGVDILKVQSTKLEREGFYTRHQIHDSVFIAVPEAEDGPDIAPAIKESMEAAVRLSVPIKVKVKRWN